MTNTHKIFLHMFVGQSGQNDHELMERDLELPFAPYIGLEIVDEEGRGFVVEHVQWWIEDTSFTVRVDPDLCEETTETLVAYWKECGWHVAC